MSESKAISNIRGKDTHELLLQQQELRKEYFELRFRSATEQVANTARFRKIRREVARIKTVLSERASAAKAGGEQ